MIVPGHLREWEFPHSQTSFGKMNDYKFSCPRNSLSWLLCSSKPPLFIAVEIGFGEKISIPSAKPELKAVPSRLLNASDVFTSSKNLVSASEISLSKQTLQLWVSRLRSTPAFNFRLQCLSQKKYLFKCLLFIILSLETNI